MPKEYQHDHPAGSPAFNTKGLLLYILPSPLVLKLVVSILSFNLVKLAFVGSALFFFYTAANLTRKTLMRLHGVPKERHHKIKDNRLWAVIYLTVGTLITAYFVRKNIPITLFMGGCSFLGYYWLYGLPSKAPKQTVDYDGMPKATREAIRNAFADLSTIESLSTQLGHLNDKPLSVTLDKVIDQSYVIMDLLVKTPEDAVRARRFLNVYINRIKEILQQYLKLAQHGKADHLRQRLSDTLTEVETAFRQKQSQLLDDDIFKLDIQLEVLDEQIKHED